jgi:GTP-binding GTPase N-terminal
MNWRCHAQHCHGVLQHAQQRHTQVWGLSRRCRSAQPASFPRHRLLRAAAAPQHSSDGDETQDLPACLPAAELAESDADMQFDWRSEVHSLAAALRWALWQLCEGLMVCASSPCISLVDRASVRPPYVASLLWMHSCDLRAHLQSLTHDAMYRAGSDGAASDAEEAEDLGPERVYLIGVAVKGCQKRYGYSIEDSLQELARLADAAGLEVGWYPGMSRQPSGGHGQAAASHAGMAMHARLTHINHVDLKLVARQVVGSTFQQLEAPSPRSYLGSGKVQEIVEAVQATGAVTVIADDELSPVRVALSSLPYGSLKTGTSSNVSQPCVALSAGPAADLDTHI